MTVSPFCLEDHLLSMGVRVLYDHHREDGPYVTGLNTVLVVMTSAGVISKRTWRFCKKLRHAGDVQTVLELDIRYWSWLCDEKRLWSIIPL